MATSIAQALLICLALSSPALAASAPTATVLNGTYEGYHLPSYSQDVFLGMPYAQTPTGDLRFRAPASLNTTWIGTRAATEYSDVCMQYTAVPDFPMSEDCLTLNVVRPTIALKKSLPVAVWIHG
jgi:carboxylesterase type B